METDSENNDRIGLRVTAFANMGRFQWINLERSLNLSEINSFVYKSSFAGARKYMEDTFSVAYQKSNNEKDLDYAFFGMFDG